MEPKQEFFEKYNPIHNTLILHSLIDNTMFDSGDEDQMEYVEERSEDNIWSYSDSGVLKNGMLFGPRVIGYVICKIPWNGKIGEIEYKI